MFNSIKFTLFAIIFTFYLIKSIAYIIYESNLKKVNSLKIDFSKMDAMTGLQFEKFISKLLEEENFSNIEVTKSSGDYGADIIALKDNIKYAIQCKRYSKKISAKPIGEVLRGMKKYHCDRGIIITNNFFTKQAIEEAKICNIELWDRNTIQSILKRNNILEILNENNNDKNINKYVDENEDDDVENNTKYLKIKELSYEDFKQEAVKIQKTYYNLGYRVKVTEVIATNKYVTEYKCIHLLEDYEALTSKEVQDEFLENLEAENARIKYIDKKYFIISIPKQLIDENS